MFVDFNYVHFEFISSNVNFLWLARHTSKSCYQNGLSYWFQLHQMNDLLDIFVHFVKKKYVGSNNCDADGQTLSIQTISVEIETYFHSIFYRFFKHREMSCVFILNPWIYMGHAPHWQHQNLLFEEGNKWRRFEFEKSN